MKNISFPGDSGGPLVVNAVLWGIVSFSADECDEPSVYTNVAYYRKWIDAKMRRY